MKLIYSMFFLFIWIANISVAQKPPSSEKEIERQYQQRIKKKYIHGVYIPEDIADAFAQLNKLIDKDSKKKFKVVSEKEAVKKLHFSLGRWMIYNWSFYEGSRLSHSIKKLGIHHPDDMASFIITTYHRYLNKEDLKVKELVESFTEKRKKEAIERKSKGKVIHEERRKRQE